MDLNEIISKLPSAGQGWTGWILAAVVTAVLYFPKAWSERRGENKEIDRLEKALVEERSTRKAAEAQNRQLSDRINDLVQKFSDQNATNARLEEQMKHLVEQNHELRKQVAHLQATVQGVHQP